ncbi:MAG: type II secretion system protein [Bdellovibrionaceae bacterium]|jgi:prepilin-type N-terminal cleavage/methylation domain-containing protein|nr:type II secretion system protein [Pseudobdellovibrionaceae bacterium]
MKKSFSQSGFTLIEVIIALMILTGSLMVLTTAWSSNFLKLNKSKRHDIAAFLLKQKVTELNIEYKGMPLEQIKEEDKGDFGEDYPQFRWEFKSQEFIMPNLAALYTAANGEEPDQMTTLVLEQMKGFFEKSVREAEIIVFAKSGRVKKEARYRVTTYFVDYNQELELPQGAGDGQ